MKLIFKGDDLGWTDGVNAGIEKAAREGVLSATGAMPNMPDAERGIQALLKYSHVSVGQHTNVVVGRPISDPRLIPHMVSEDGNFHSSSYYRKLAKTQEDVMPYPEECRIEIIAQLNKFIEYAGKLPDYLEGHAVPSATFEKVLSEVANEYGIIYIGLEQYNTEYGVYRASLGKYGYDIFTCSDKYSQFESDVISYIVNDEAKVLEHDLAILLFHPGYVDADIMRMSSFHGVRLRDTEALCSQEVKDWIQKNNIEVVNYSALKKVCSA